MLKSKEYLESPLTSQTHESYTRFLTMFQCVTPACHPLSKPQSPHLKNEGIRPEPWQEACLLNRIPGHLFAQMLIGVSDERVSESGTDTLKDAGEKLGQTCMNAPQNWRIPHSLPCTSAHCHSPGAGYISSFWTLNILRKPILIEYMWGWLRN